VLFRGSRSHSVAALGHRPTAVAVVRPVRLERVALNPRLRGQVNTEVTAIVGRQTLSPPPSNPASTTPARQPNSVRRTSHLNMLWSDGASGPMRIEAQARDLATRADGSTEVLARSVVEAEIGEQRTVTAIHTPFDATPPDGLVGARGGGGFRRQLQEVLAADFAAGTPRYYLLDDLSAATLIGGFAFRVWNGARPDGDQPGPAPQRDMTDICSGFRADGVAITLHRRGYDTRHQLARAARNLIDPNDPLGWHDVTEPTLQYPVMRRRRRVDVTRVGDQVSIDAMFRDAA
jgi:hypothetical protein